MRARRRSVGAVDRTVAGGQARNVGLEPPLGPDALLDDVVLAPSIGSRSWPLSVSSVRPTSRAAPGGRSAASPPSVAWTAVSVIASPPIVQDVRDSMPASTGMANHSLGGDEERKKPAALLCSASRVGRERLEREGSPRRDPGEGPLRCTAVTVAQGEPIARRAQVHQRTCGEGESGKGGRSETLSPAA